MHTKLKCVWLLVNMKMIMKAYKSFYPSKGGGAFYSSNLFTDTLTEILQWVRFLQQKSDPDKISIGEKWPRRKLTLSSRLCLRRVNFFMGRAGELKCWSRYGGFFFLRLPWVNSYRGKVTPSSISTADQFFTVRITEILNLVFFLRLSG